ncbi:MAG: FtsX-like permease family protein [Spirochaetota bacterium]
MNYFLRNIILIFQEIRKNIFKTLLSSFGMIFLISFLVVSISIKNSVSDYLKKRIFGELKINQVKITPQSQTSVLKFSASDIAISDAQIKKIRNIEGLENLEEVIRLNCPTSLKAGMLGMYLKTDMLISGVDASFFKDTKLKWKDFKQKDYIPVVVPLFVMDVYNNFAASNGLPALGPKALNMLSIEMLIGRSSFVRNSRKEFKFKAKLFGFTETITTAGIIVPSAFIKDFCRANSEDLQLTENCYSRIMLVGSVKDIKQIPGVTGKIQALNLSVESQADIANKTEKALFLLNVTLSLIFGIILVLTVLAVFNSYLAVVYNRSYVFSIQRMLGTSKLRIVLIFVLESGIIGALYGLAGYFIGYYLMTYLTNNIPNWMPLLQGLNFKLETHEYLPAVIAFSVLVSNISALIPAVFASNLNLFNAVKR